MKAGLIDRIAAVVARRVDVHAIQTASTQYAGRPTPKISRKERRRQVGTGYVVGTRYGGHALSLDDGGQATG